MKRLQSLLFSLGFAVFITLIVYWKIPAKGLIPFPGDLLVGRFFPYNTMNWEGYPLGVPYKEFINADVVRQLYPWRDLALKLIKKGELPWWNPYAFAGNPLLSNIQSAPFYPLNFLYFLTDHRTAWILGVMLQPILAILFMMLFMRELSLAKPACVFAAIAFAFSGYMVIWWELNTVGHAALWLPFILWGIEKWRKTQKQRFLPAIIFGQTASLLAGHLQTAVYVLIFSLTFFLFRILCNKSKERINLIRLYFVALIITGILVSPQLLPALQLLPLTPRGLQQDSEIFNHFLLPPKHLVTFFVHDFFGNPATKNFWGIDYGEFMGYFGVVALFLALVSLTNKKSRETRFFFATAIVALLFALPTPLPHLLRLARIPILSTSAPSRTLFIVQFCGAVLAGFGLNDWLTKEKIKLKTPVILMAGIYIAILVISIVSLRNASPTTLVNWKVSLRNLVIPSLIFLTISVVTIVTKKIKLAQRFTIRISALLLVLIAGAEYSYFANKFQTFSEPRFFFPETQIFSYILGQSGKTPYRFFGDYTAAVDSNIWIPYGIYGVEGYDSLYIGRFGELLAASQNGQIPEIIPRSDANLVKNQDDIRRRRLEDLLGVRYILDKNDNPKSDWEPEPGKFPVDRYALIWQQGKFKVYENKQSLPRAFLVGQWTLENNPQKAVDLIFNKDFNLDKTVILEEPPAELISASAGKVEFIGYDPNRAELKVETSTRQILFVSDTYYPDWTASVDGTPTKIFRANYAFRAIVIPAGNHSVIFHYKPKLF